MKTHTNYTTLITAMPWARRGMTVLAALLALVVASAALVYTVRYSSRQSAVEQTAPVVAAPVPIASSWRFRDEALAGVQLEQAIGTFSMPERLADVRQAGSARAASAAPARLYGPFNRVFADERLAAQAYSALYTTPAGALLDTPVEVRRSGPR